MVETIAAPGVDPRLVLGPLAMMHADPTMRLGRHEAIRATYTPDGPGVTRLTWGQQSREVAVETSGDGAAWLLDQAPRLSLIAQVLSGARRADDTTMLALLEPFRPHRYRVLRLALAARMRH